MKKLLVYLFLLFASFLYAQAPQGINYQAVARDVAGTVLQNQSMAVRLTIHMGGTSNPIYGETHNVSTNQFGLFSLKIGQPTTVLFGSFSGISWGTSTYFLEVEIDPGTGFINMGTTQFMSVPYALYAEQAGNAAPGTNGLNCWDLNGNGIKDFPAEDKNLDGIIDVADCKGDPGLQGAVGPAGILAPGSAFGNTPFWNGTTWDLNSNNLYNDGSNVGIGTTPSYKLDVAGIINSQGYKYDGGAPLGTYLRGNGFVFSPSTIPISDLPNGASVWDKSGSSAYLSTPSDFVGIGNTSPAYNLDVTGTTKTDALVLPSGAIPGSVLTASDYAGTAVWKPSSKFSGSGANNYTARWVSTDSLGTGSLIDDGTNVGIGMYPGYKLDVAGYTRVQGLQSDMSGTASAGSFVISNALNSNNAIFASSVGSGSSIYSYNTGTGPAAIFNINNPLNSQNSIFSATNGTGSAVNAVNYGLGNAGTFEITSSINNSPALYVATSGTGNAGEFYGKVKIADGSQFPGRLFVSDAFGVGSWQDAPAISGSVGTMNYLSKWNSPGTALTNSQVYDDGNYVGIGTNNPGYKLHTVMTSGYVGIEATNVGATYGMRFISPDRNWYFLLSGGGSPVGSFNIYDGTANAYRFSINPTNGNIGLGNTNTVNKLGVSGNSSIGANYVTATAPANGLLVEGNVGIGTTNAPYDLTLGGTGPVLGFENTSIVVAKNSLGSYENFLWPRWSDNITYMNYGSGGFNLRNNSGTTTMFMTAGGNVGIGSGTAASSKLEVNGTVTISGANTNELNRAQTGTANMAAIAYGSVEATGIIHTLGSTGNFTVAKTGTGVYTITITGEAYFYTDYTAIATLTGGPGEIQTNSGGGKLYIYTYDSSGAPLDRLFNFVVYKP